MPRRSFVLEFTAAGMMLAAFFSPSSASACDTPVFRYAMTYWRPDAYTAILFHRGPLSDEQKALVERLTPMADAEPLTNTTVRRVNLDEPLTADLERLWATQAGTSLPWLVVTYPETSPVPGMLWSGPLDVESIDGLIDSPFRRTIARRLTRGDAAVWVLLESDDDAANADAAEMLTAELRRCERLLTGDGTSPSDPAAGPPIEPVPVRFSLVRLGRGDPSEKLLVDMLLHCEPDLRQYDAPMALPVFGRGRALYALVGDGINAEQIARTCRFITEGCQCEVKRQNPGADLLMHADWRRSPARVATEDATPRTLEETITRQTAPPGLPSENGIAAGPAMLWRSLAAVLGGVGVISILAWITARRMHPADRN